VKLGVCIPLVNPTATADFVRRVGTVSEQLGFESLWVGEHVVLFDEHDSSYESAPGEDKTDAELESEQVELEPFTSLAYLAACTTTIRLGTGVCVLPQRNPVYAAKEAANVDWLSGGRLDFGVGLGWLAEEYQAVGASFARRGARLESYLEVVRTCWNDEVSEYRDEFYELPACRFYPKPLQDPHPAIVLGGNTEATFRRLARGAQGWYALSLSPEQIAPRLELLDAALADEGRTRAEIQIRACPWPDPYDEATIEGYAELGLDEVVLMEFPNTPDEAEATLEQLMGRFGPVVQAR
jgi:probable F420-dependent oxidoreductase